MIIVTTNAVSNGWGKMVMGAGSAAQAKEVYPELTRIAYKKIKERYPEYRLNGHNEDYGFLPIFEPPHGVGIFQTQRHWAETARLDTIQRSVDHLAAYASLHPDVNFRLPFPGVGCGRWGEGEPPEEEEIKRLLVCLPDNVTVVTWR
jgi:hypothetical protein